MPQVNDSDSISNKMHKWYFLSLKIIRDSELKIDKVHTFEVNYQDTETCHHSSSGKYFESRLTLPWKNYPLHTT